ncbi:MAG: hypothetical protein FIA99_05725 [Ruminiclostridium sp.]|nr:hypothetical protein [Ruminiclostridium sp.]
MKMIKFFKIIMLAATTAIILSVNNAGISAIRLDDDISVPAEGERLISGPVRDVPWEQDETFFKAKMRNDTNVLMAAYRTVLKDPLPGEEDNVHLAAKMLRGLLIRQGQIFSQNGSIGPYTIERGFQKGPTYMGTKLTTTIGGGVCKIASTLYNVTALCDLEIVERYNHTMPVPYVPYGQDATVAYGARDFRFRNNTGTPIMIWAEGVDNILYIAIFGRFPAPDVQWRHETLVVRKAPREVSKNPNLKSGEEKVVLEGMDGAVVKSWLYVKGPDWTRVRYMGVSDYKPMPYSIEIGN